MKNKTVIFISCSNENKKPLFSFMHNIQAGTALSEYKFPDMDSDNLGDNISELNPYYCELTVQYFAWKNSDARYLGFCHSRRYFSFDLSRSISSDSNRKRMPKPYTVEKLPTKALLEKYGYNEITVSDLLEKYPIIAVLPEKMYENARERFIRTQKNGKHELELIEGFIKEKYIEFLPSFESYMNSKALYFCNMFIMRRDIFDNYCTWLFDILSYVDSRLPERLPRDDGMIGEQLFGVYMTYIKCTKKINWLEVPRIHFSNIGGASKNFSCNRIGNILLPPGTPIRNILRKIMKG